MLTHPLANPTTISNAICHLQQTDPLLAEIIKKEPQCDIKSHTDYYQALVRSIVGQQLSVKAAAAIYGRFLELFGGVMPTPTDILTKTEDEYRVVGFSYAKARYIRDLAVKIIDGDVQFEHFNKLSNDEIVTELTNVKGIGEWTVHMFLMFCMGRLDVLAPGDLGIKNGIQCIYDLDRPPTPTEITEIAKNNHWHPYETVACWYIWESLDNSPK